MPALVAEWNGKCPQGAGTPHRGHTLGGSSAGRGFSGPDARGIHRSLWIDQGVGETVSVENVIGLVLAIAALIYVGYALLNPERFS